MRRLLLRAKEVCREHGLEVAAVMALKWLTAPAVRFGSFYFLECDLNRGLPQVSPIGNITVREAFLTDVHLLGGTQETEHTRRDAVARLQEGHRWFVGIDEATGKLTNYRWVALTSAFIPETGRDLVLRPGEAYIYDLVTIAEYRRRGIDKYTRQWVYRYLHQSAGVVRILAYIHPENRPNLAASRHFLTCIGRVWYVCTADWGIQLFARGQRLPEFRPRARVARQTAFAARRFKPRSDANS